MAWDKVQRFAVAVAVAVAVAFFTFLGKLSYTRGVLMLHAGQVWVALDLVRSSYLVLSHAWATR